MDKFSYKFAVIDLIYLQGQVEKLIKKYPKYSLIGKSICSEDYFDENSDTPFPTMTSISRDTGLKYNMVRKSIKEIHDLIFADDENNLIFPKVKYRFCFSFLESHFDFTLYNLAVLPRVGENIHIPFFKARLDMQYFYVEEVNYIFEKEFQIVEIWCKAGFGNQYLKFRKDKAEALGEISRDEIWKVNNYSMERKLREGQIKV